MQKFTADIVDEYVNLTNNLNWTKN
jgi:hypothetical protein